jgi:outer membrane lipoprotein-sorting protein
MRALILLLAGLWLASSAAVAAPKAPAALSEADKASVKKAEDYLNGLSTLRARFLQVTEDGHTRQGTFSLKRPGKMRIDYDAPAKDFIVADGRFVYFWDAELKQQQNAPIGSTMADVILRPELKLSGDVTVTEVQRDAGVLDISVVDAKEPGKGKLTLVFEENPFQLRKWKVLDAAGATTEVALSDLQPGAKLDDEQFYFRDPNRKKERD